MNVGILVDSVSEVLDIQQDDIELTLPHGRLTLESRFVQGIVRTGGREVILLNLDAVATVDDLEFTLRHNAITVEK